MVADGIYIQQSNTIELPWSQAPIAYIMLLRTSIDGLTNGHMLESIVSGIAENFCTWMSKIYHIFSTTTQAVNHKNWGGGFPLHQYFLIEFVKNLIGYSGRDWGGGP